MWLRAVSGADSRPARREQLVEAGGGEAGHFDLRDHPRQVRARIDSRERAAADDRVGARGAVGAGVAAAEQVIFATRDDGTEPPLDERVVDGQPAVLDEARERALLIEYD